MSKASKAEPKGMGKSSAQEATTARVPLNAHKVTPLRLFSTHDGLAVSGSLLWLDAHNQGDLSFISGAQGLAKTLKPKIIASEPTMAIFQALGRRPNALVCQYHRGFALGRLRFELCPSGHGLGGSLLRVEGVNQEGPFLYAPFWQPQRIAHGRKMKAPQSTQLIVGATTPPSYQLKDRKREKERLLEDLKAALHKNQNPIVAVAAFGLAQELTSLLSKDHGLSVAVHPLIGKIHRVYRDHGEDLGPFTIGAPRRPRGRITLVPWSAGSPRPKLSTHAVASGEPVLGSYYLPLSATMEELPELLAMVKPESTSYLGPHALAYVRAHEAAKHISIPQPIFLNNQPPLFGDWPPQGGAAGLRPSP